MKKQTFNLIGWNKDCLIPDGYLPIAFNLDDITFKIVPVTGEFLILEVTEWKEKTKWENNDSLPDGHYNNWLDKGTITGSRCDIDNLLFSLCVSRTENYIQYRDPKIEANNNLADAINSLASRLSFIEDAITKRFSNEHEFGNIE